MLEGKKVNLRIMEKEDIPLLAKWHNDLEFAGEFFMIPQRAIADFEKGFNERSQDSATFIIEEKDGTAVGWIAYFLTRYGGYATSTEIGYIVTPDSRGKGYCSEAIAIILDYLFLLKDIHRIQAVIAVENVASARVVEKNGFTKEGTLRKLGYRLNRWINASLYSILREEWDKPKILRQ